MSMGRVEKREWLVKLAYQTQGVWPAEEALADLLAQHDLPAEDAYLRTALRSLSEHGEAIDAQIADCLHNWRFDRLLRIDRAILRVAINEMCYTHQAPVRVVINEAVELAKKYSDADAYRFINGVLSTVARTMESSQ